MHHSGSGSYLTSLLAILEYIRRRVANAHDILPQGVDAVVKVHHARVPAAEMLEPGLRVAGVQGVRVYGGVPFLVDKVVECLSDAV